MSGHVVALCGGVGGAKLVHGLARVLPDGALTVIVNTGDDFEHLGLQICPDLDAVIYALAELDDPSRGWGRREETWTFLRAVRGLGGESWFQLGDADLAMHVLRTRALGAGSLLSEFTRQIARTLALNAQILPMSDDPVRTQLRTDGGWLDFQEYFVHRRCEPRIEALRFVGASTARCQPEVLAALARPDLAAVVICPSNPFVSIGPMLTMPALRAAVEGARAPVIAVTPIIGGKAVKGPAAKMLQELGFEVGPAAVADYYRGLLDAFVSDESDPPLSGVADAVCLRLPTLMRTLQDREALALGVLEAAARLA